MVWALVVFAAVIAVQIWRGKPVTSALPLGLGAAVIAGAVRYL